MEKISKGFENCKIWVVVLSMFLLSSILGSQVKAGWVDVTGATYYLGGNVGIGTSNTYEPFKLLKTGVDTGIPNSLTLAVFDGDGAASGISLGYKTDEVAGVISHAEAGGSLLFYTYNGGWSEKNANSK